MRSGENSNQEILNQQAERESFRDMVFQSALEERPELGEIQEAEMKALIKIADNEIEILENLADRKNVLTALTPEVADRISAIWVLSGTGTYDDSRSGEKVPTAFPEAYRNRPWTWGMDRARLSYGAFLIRKIAELKSGTTISSGPKGEVDGRIGRSREAIIQHGPTLIYNGADVQNEAVLRVLEQPDIVMPEDKMHVFGTDNRNTLDQIKSFILPESLHKPGGEIGLISHAPHLMRIMHMLNRYRPLPADMHVRLFPIATPPERKAEYASMEIKGLLYYTFLSKNRDATVESYPHKVHGEV